MANGCGHETVRAFNPKAVPWKTGLYFVWLQVLKCSVIAYVTGLNQMLFHYHPIHVGPSTQYVTIN